MTTLCIADGDVRLTTKEHFVELPQETPFKPRFELGWVSWWWDADIPLGPVFAEGHYLLTPEVLFAAGDLQWSASRKGPQ